MTKRKIAEAAAASSGTSDASSAVIAQQSSTIANVTATTTLAQPIAASASYNIPGFQLTGTGNNVVFEYGPGQEFQLGLSIDNFNSSNASSGNAPGGSGNAPAGYAPAPATAGFLGAEEHELQVDDWDLQRVEAEVQAWNQGLMMEVANDIMAAQSGRVDTLVDENFDVEAYLNNNL